MEDLANQSLVPEAFEAEVNIELDNLNLNQLQDLLLSLETSIQDLDVETTIFDKHFNRVNSHQINDAKNSENKQDDDKAILEADEMGKNSKHSRKKKLEKKAAMEAFLSLTMDQKFEIANREIEETKDMTAFQIEEWAKVSDNFKAELECAEFTLAELKKYVSEFKRDIITGAVDERTGKVSAEKFQRYYEEKIRAKDASAEKIRLKNASLRSQRYKLQQQLKQKEEMGEVLHAIDYDQLQIENSQYLVKIEEKNQELSALKFKTGNILQKLNNYKKKLDSISKDTETFAKDIYLRKDLIQKLVQEGERVSAEKHKESNSLTNLKQQIEDFKIPEVMEYVQLQAEQRDLESKINILSRKIEIHGHELSRLKIGYNRLLKQKTVKMTPQKSSRKLKKQEKIRLPALH